MKTINTSLYDFPRLRDPENGCIYVDKTARLYEIAKPSADCIYYLPRPRRFGKSLMLSTLEALFRGRRELFRGLAIDSMDWNWEREVYPVLHLDMAVVASKNAAELEISLQDLVQGSARTFGAPFDPDKPAKTNFKNLLSALSEKSPNGRYVVLIDEYDAPVSGLLDTETGRRELPVVRKTLHDFYVQAKSQCGNMRFLMVTGVSKFAKTSIFSAFNNPCDLTFDERAADLLGYTHEEIETYFHEHVQAFAEANGQTYAEAFAKLLEWYDSYQFCAKKPVKVINPVSLGKALTAKELGNYWEATAGSTLIYDALKARNRTPVDFDVVVDRETLDAADALTAPVESLLYQGGYLTIDRAVRSLDLWKLKLKVPNEEVRLSLQRGYMASVLGRDFEFDGFRNAAEATADRISADPAGDGLKKLLISAYSKLPHDWRLKDETEAKRYFLSFMVFARAEVVGEEQHSLGRPDAVLRTGKGVYVFEFKYGESATAALKQCRERRYADAFAADARRVVYVGINYSPELRTIDEVKCEPAETPGVRS